MISEYVDYSVQVIWRLTDPVAIVKKSQDMHNSDLAFSRNNNVIWVWNDMRINK